MTSELPKSFSPAEIEKLAADCWVAERLFHAEPTDPGTPYAVVIPPPNVTGALHLGHALNNTLQDILVRWRRMCGDNAVWLPGTDHAGIATQSVVEKRLHKEGKRRTDFSRDEFIAIVQTWKDEYEARILGQLKAMGCSCDFERTAFTMDDLRAKAVREAFFRFFKDGLIYRGKRLVNWDPVLKTAVADDEVVNEEVDGFFYYLRYPIEEASPDRKGDGPFDYVTVATTRPETMLGDTAVAINPKDPRAAQLRGKHVRLPIVNRVVPIIEDDFVVLPVSLGGDPADVKAQFATGFLKVTPAHDPNDYDIGQRHNLAMINVMAPDASISLDHGWAQLEPQQRLNAELKPLLGKGRDEARTAVVHYFRDNGLLEDSKPYKHSVGHSERSAVPIEPYLSDQWYLKVTDQRMARAANAVLTSRDREGAVARAISAPAFAQTPLEHEVGSALAYFITFTTYGTWLHGREEGSVDRGHNTPGTPVVDPDAAREEEEFNALKHAPIHLDEPRRRRVFAAIKEVCVHRQWRLRALHVRTNHIHVVVSAEAPPERVMNDFKSYATRAMREAGLLRDDERTWTRHGSTRYLNDARSLFDAVSYVVEQQGEPLAPAPFDERSNGAPTEEVASQPLPYGRGSSDVGTVEFHPARYAKMYETWHDNIRDWCISRQLWWGHRIPVWRRPTRYQGSLESAMQALERLIALQRKGKLWLQLRGQHVEATPAELNDDTLVALYIAVPEQFDQDAEVTAALREIGAEQDPDVLDTWFSSALWPMSTLGWPDQTIIVNRQSTLNTWNPTSVLCTAREIITLWVSRMVMMNLYMLGRVPFRDVYIHAVIQDGEGRKMSKSLGNGVDPLDIIHSHGADAMRYTLASMATNTQDVRLPVEPDPATGRNTSPKFDIGKAFCTKLWNASRFVLMQLEKASFERSDEATERRSDEGKKEATSAAASPSVASSLRRSVAGASAPVGSEANWTMADRWIVSRFNRTASEVHEALSTYRFDQYAKAIYDFFWRDFCDWYVEAAKPQMRSDAQKAHTAQILATVLDGALRLMHPVIPHVTEVLWWKLNEIAPNRGLAGRIDCPARAPRIIRAPFPVDSRNYSEAAEHIFPKIQEVITTIRNVRNEYKIDAKKPVNVTIMSPGDAGRQIEALRPAIESMATCRLVKVASDATPPANSVRAVADKCELYIEGLIDPAAEQARSGKLREDLEKKVATLKGRLANEGYIARAPAKLVQETKDQLAAAEAELAKLG